eukprot:1160277-Pelagomonas_calceolata.AAC.2
MKALPAGSPGADRQSTGAQIRGKSMHHTRPCNSFLSRRLSSFKLPHHFHTCFLNTPKTGHWREVCGASSHHSAGRRVGGPCQARTPTLWPGPRRATSLWEAVQDQRGPMLEAAKPVAIPCLAAHHWKQEGLLPPSLETGEPGSAPCLKPLEVPVRHCVEVPSGAPP